MEKRRGEHETRIQFCWGTAYVTLNYFKGKTLTTTWLSPRRPLLDKRICRIAYNSFTIIFVAFQYTCAC